MSAGTSPVARELARAATARDVARLRQHEDTKRYGWTVEYDGDVLVTVMLRAISAHSPPAEHDLYTVTLDCDSYDVWPPEVKFVNQESRSYLVGADVSALPVVSGVSGFAVHPAFTGFYDSRRTDQLVCFSFARGYYDSNHTPTERERWQPGRHWLYSTVRYIARALQPPYYQGRMR